MSNTTNEHTAESIFGNAVSTYTRAQALADGVLVDASKLAKDAGFKWPVALTAAVWAECVVWTDEDCARKAYQDQTGRLWDVLYMASQAIRARLASGDMLLFELYQIPRNGRVLKPVPVELKLIIGPGDAGEPVVTILLPHED